MAMLREAHWAELLRQGYTVVTGVTDPALLRPAQLAAQHLNDLYPSGGWERAREQLWRELRICQDEDLMSISSNVLDPLALEIVDQPAPADFIQLASTLPGFAARRAPGRYLHIDGGKEHGVFNVLFGVALTDVSSDTVGGLHVLPGSHDAFARAFRRQHWGNVRDATLRLLLEGGHLVVPRLKAGDVIVAHAFLAHGTSTNLSRVRRDMLFQRRSTIALKTTAEVAKKQLMRDPWSFFRRRPHQDSSITMAMADR